MSDRKVIPFRKRPKSPAVLLAYRHATQKWQPEMQQLPLPDHFQLEPPRPKK
jgi:hypothetical protein